MASEQEKSNVTQEYNVARVGLDMDNSLSGISKGKLTYALNATLENFDANGVSYQNEEGNEYCLSFPEGYSLIGKYFIPEKNKHLFFLANAFTGDSEIGYMENNDCSYHTLINSPCLYFDINHPIHKLAHRITNCSTEIYWADQNGRRYLDIDNIPYKLVSGSPNCDPVYSNELDCNRIRIQPEFDIPEMQISDVVSGGDLKAGVYQFAVQYADSLGNPFTSYYSITNPIPIADITISSLNFDYPVGKSIVVEVNNIDISGLYRYINIAVIKTINAVTSVELIGTYYIETSYKKITYSGQAKDNIRLTIDDVFEKYPYYDIAEDITAVQDILVWSQLTTVSRNNYQQIANKITLQWETWRIPATENYANEINAANLRGYLRDEVYPFEICFLLKGGKQTDAFHIPGRTKGDVELSTPDVADTNNDFTGNPDYTIGDVGYKPYWKVYNTANVIDYSQEYDLSEKYKGAYQYGEFAYWESEETYPCNADLWGELAGQPIRHHKFPDISVSPIIETENIVLDGSFQPVMKNVAVFPIGVRVDMHQIKMLINSSDLSPSQKEDIIGVKILRGDRNNHKSIVAKGILRNVNTYSRGGQDYYYPNYPYNDLNEDPFLNSNNNAFTQLCNTYDVNITKFGDDNKAVIEYRSCDTNKDSKQNITELGITEVCSITKPKILSPAEGTVGVSEYEIWEVWVDCGIWASCRGFEITWIDPIKGITKDWLSGAFSAKTDQSGFNNFVNPERKIITVVANTGGPVKTRGADNFKRRLLGVRYPEKSCNVVEPSVPLKDVESLKYRQVFNSPETSFGKPFLGNVLKLESVIFGKGLAHFTEVENNARYKLLTKEAQIKAIKSANDLGKITDDFDTTAMFTAYQAYLDLYIKSIPRKNYAYSFNSIADYNYSVPVPNEQGVKQRDLEINRYLIPGVLSVGDDNNINNYQRETSVYLKTDEILPFPSESPNINNGFIENSRFTLSEKYVCDSPEKENDISVISYYASIKNEIVNQWGQIYSYETIDTGFQKNLEDSSTFTVFGGDTFISRFAFKTKLPFFTDNRVGAPDDSDVYYDEIGNVAYPKYWHSARSITSDYTVGDSPGYVLSNIISYKAHNFDCANTLSGIEDATLTTTTTLISAPEEQEDDMYYDGKFYLFAYGIPSFYCETSYNTDLRQAFNAKEGDFWPHVSTSIPDEWLQETNVSIANDNTYYYNTTFSKQNKENTFTHLPANWDAPCFTSYPFRAVYSDTQDSNADNTVNSWLIYRATSYFDFPQNYGKLISLDGIQNSAILARFENKSLLYNNLLTIDTSNPQAAYMGNDKLFRGAPPIDFAETDLGYVGTQNKMLMKLPYGQVTIDAKRGQLFLLQGTSAKELSGAGSGMNRFFTDHLSFEILKHFPDIPTDNHFNGIGLHGVYDSKYDRMLITKLDYIPISDNVKYDEDTHSFYVEEEIVIPPTTTSTSTTSTTSTSSSTTSTSSTTTTSTTEIPVTTTTTSTTSTSSTTTTTTTPALAYHIKMSVNDTIYDFLNEENIPYASVNTINTPMKSGYNYLFLSIPVGQSFTITDSLGTNVTAYFSIDVASGIGGVDSRPGYNDNNIYKSDDMFATAFSTEYTLTLI